MRFAYNAAMALVFKWMSLQSIFGFLLISLVSCPQQTTNDTVPPPTEVVHVEPNSSYSVARNWNEMLLEAIRSDRARPTVHARNLFHTAIVMYDAWAAYDDTAQPYLLGQSLNGQNCSFSGFTKQAEQSLEEARAMTMSYAAYGLLKYRFGFSANAEINVAIDRFMADMGYNTQNNSLNYSTGDAAALGNHLARCMILAGQTDGAKELEFYSNRDYQFKNEGLDPKAAGNPNLLFPNNWQPLVFDDCFVDQSGNCLPVSVATEFMGAEWGKVTAFALPEAELSKKIRDGTEYWFYFDPGVPPLLEQDTEAYRWNFAMVAAWSALLDPSNKELIDISPKSMGNLATESYPSSLEEYQAFYDPLKGPPSGEGHSINPVTGEAYEENKVLLGDYTRVIAEFWADGPDSETPPGHWFTLLNYVSDHPEFEKRFEGQGPILDALEWDVKAYFALGATMHDAAIAAWGIKGYYDFVRPISAIRFMADQGQSSDPDLPNYSDYGLPLIEGRIELVNENDPLVGANQEHLHKLKLYAWLGPTQITNEATDTAGVGWMLAESWWPYQRPSFITPPFAGYVSGHSTFSRAAAELLTLLTGDAYFPGGLGEFVAPKNEFLVFEEGPSESITLQWATYRDASDQTSLSRIWGGIHPPIDDIPGRLIGIRVGHDAFDLAKQYFNAE